MSSFLTPSRTYKRLSKKQQSLFKNSVLSYAQLKRQSQLKINQEYPLFSSATRKNSVIEHLGKKNMQSFQQFNRSRSKSSQKKYLVQPHRNDNNNKKAPKKRPLTAWSDSFKEKRSQQALYQSWLSSQGQPGTPLSPHINNEKQNPHVHVLNDNTKAFKYFVEPHTNRTYCQKNSFQYLLQPCKISKLDIQHRPGSAITQYGYLNIGSQKAVIVKTSPRRYHSKSYHKPQNPRQKITPWDNQKSQNIEGIQILK